MNSQDHPQQTPWSLRARSSNEKSRYSNSWRTWPQPWASRCDPRFLNVENSWISFGLDTGPTISSFRMPCLKGYIYIYIFIDIKEKVSIGKNVGSLTAISPFFSQGMWLIFVVGR